MIVRNATLAALRDVGYPRRCDPAWDVDDYVQQAHLVTHDMPDPLAARVAYLRTRQRVYRYRTRPREPHTVPNAPAGLQRTLDTVLDAVDPVTATVLRLRAEGATYAAIAAHTGLPLTRVTYLLSTRHLNGIVRQSSER